MSNSNHNIIFSYLWSIFLLFFFLDSVLRQGLQMTGCFWSDATATTPNTISISTVNCIASRNFSAHWQPQIQQPVSLFSFYRDVGVVAMAWIALKVNKSCRATIFLVHLLDKKNNSARQSDAALTSIFFQIFRAEATRVAFIRLVAGLHVHILHFSSMFRLIYFQMVPHLNLKINMWSIAFQCFLKGMTLLVFIGISSLHLTARELLMALAE